MAAYLYRCYDGAGRLVYVGCTRDLFTRLRGHRYSWWAEQVTKVVAKVYPTIASGRAAETQAIRSEVPRWNLKQRWDGPRLGWQPQDYADHMLALLTTPVVYGTRTRRRMGEVRREFEERFGYPLPERDVAV